MKQFGPRRLESEDSRVWQGGAITRQVLADLLRERFAMVDFKRAPDEVRVFQTNPRELQLWTREFFEGLTAQWK